MTPRPPERDDLVPLAALWHDTWHEAHAAIVPAELLTLRSQAQFLRRLEKHRDEIRLISDAAGPLGFCQIDPRGLGELDQLFVAPRARGQGVAQTLLHDGEARLRAAGCLRPRLLCIPQNARARSFYRRTGWVESAVERAHLKTEAGPFSLTCVVFRKELGVSAVQNSARERT